MKLINIFIIVAYAVKQKPSKAERQAAWRAKQNLYQSLAMERNSWLTAGDDDVDASYLQAEQEVVFPNSQNSLADTTQPVLSQFSGRGGFGSAPVSAVSVDLANQFIEKSVEKLVSNGGNDKTKWLLEHTIHDELIRSLIDKDETEKMIEKSKRIIQAAAALEDTGRNSGSNNGFLDLSAVWNYGCWCSFNEELLQGKGEPKNLVDQACKDLTMCARCNVIDHPDEECNPVTTFYNAPLAKPGEELNVSKHCMRANRRSSCRRAVCSCETEFAAAIIRIFFESSEVFDPAFKHSNNFDRELECKTQVKSLTSTTSNVVYNAGGTAKSPGRISTSSDGETQCCGVYPKRKPFVVTPARQCCGYDTFNSATHDCCDGERIADPGAC